MPGALAALGSWSGTAPIPGARASAVAASLPGGKVLVTGGTDSGIHATADSEVFTPALAATPPTCRLTAVRRAGPTGHDQADVTVTAAGGLQSITNVLVSNGSVPVPAFTPGTTAPVIVTATKTTQGVRTIFSFDATDQNGTVTHCQ